MERLSCTLAEEYRSWLPADLQRGDLLNNRPGNRSQPDVRPGSLSLTDSEGELCEQGCLV